MTNDGTVLSPTAIQVGTTADDLQTAARVIEMLLISDHTRMKTAATPYDSTHAQQFRLLPISHPEDWAAASDGPDRSVEESAGSPHTREGVRSVRRRRHQTGSVPGDASRASQTVSDRTRSVPVRTRGVSRPGRLAALVPAPARRG